MESNMFKRKIKSFKLLVEFAYLNCKLVFFRLWYGDSSLKLDSVMMAIESNRILRNVDFDVLLNKWMVDCGQPADKV
jgi:hypothetical protein